MFLNGDIMMVPGLPSVLYTDANIMIGEQDMARAEMVKTGGCGT